MRPPFGRALLRPMGRGVPQKNAESLTWLRRAAEPGDATSQLALGGTCAQGLGVGKTVESLRWAPSFFRPDRRLKSLLSAKSRDPDSGAGPARPGAQAAQWQMKKEMAPN